MILAIDTSTEWMGLALADLEMVWYEKVWKTMRRHTVELAPAVNLALNETGLSPKSLSSIAVALGPGSFTSLRIGLAFAKGLSLSLNIPVVGIPTLDITARGQSPADIPLLCVLRSGRGRLAVCEYQYTQKGWQAISEIYTASAQELEEKITSPTIVRGEIDEQERRCLKRRWRNALVADPDQNIRRPSVLAAMALEQLDENGKEHAFLLNPIYVQTLAHPGQPSAG